MDSFFAAVRRKKKCHFSYLPSRSSSPHLLRVFSGFRSGLVWQGVGKTTLITKILEKLRVAHPELKIRGFYTRETRQGGERTGFEVVTMDGQHGTLASALSGAVSSRWPNVGKYKVDVAGFEALALPELEVNGDSDLIVIDEIGKMELFSAAFFPAVLDIFNSNIPVLASIPVPKYGRDIPEVAQIRSSADAKLYMLSKKNRDDMVAEIHAQLNSLLEQNS